MHMFFDFIPMILKNCIFNVHLSRISKVQVYFFYFLSICFIESRRKVEEILDFSSFLDIPTPKCIYVLSTFTLKDNISNFLM